MIYPSYAQNDAPIGIMDSGSGGLTIWREIRRALPQESTIYIGDHAYQPYGGRPSGQIRLRTRRLISFLFQKHAKFIIIACNTATVAGIDQYRKWFPSVPIIGVVPVVKTAASITKTNHVAVMSTPYTAASRYQKRLIKMFAGDCHVENIGVPDLVPLLEQGNVGGRVRKILVGLLREKSMQGVDVIALGCTHFPFIKEQICRIVGEGVSVIDSGRAVARHVERILEAEKLRTNTREPYTMFTTTGDAAHVSRVATNLMGEQISFVYGRV